jgi:hypothetical protein
MIDVVYKLTPLQHPDYDEIMLTTEKNKKAFKLQEFGQVTTG